MQNIAMTERRVPTITVAVACYNYGLFIEDCLESIFAQERKADEIIVINDGSTDNSDDIIKALLNRYDFTYINQENEGVVAVRNEFIKNAKSDFLIQIDADDTIPGNYIKEIELTLLQNEADIYYTPAHNLDTGEVIVPSTSFNKDELKRHNYIHTSSAIRISRIKNRAYDEALDKIGLEDWDMFLGLVLDGATALPVKSTHLNYRLHQSSASRSDLSRSDVNQLKAIAHIYHKYSRSHTEEMSGCDWIADNIMKSLNIIGDTRGELASVKGEVQQIRSECDQRMQHLQLELDNVYRSKKWKLLNAMVRVSRGK